MGFRVAFLLVAFTLPSVAGLACGNHQQFALFAGHHDGIARLALRDSSSTLEFGRDSPCRRNCDFLTPGRPRIATVALHANCVGEQWNSLRIRQPARVSCSAQRATSDPSSSRPTLLQLVLAAACVGTFRLRFHGVFTVLFQALEAAVAFHLNYISVRFRHCALRIFSGVLMTALSAAAAVAVATTSRTEDVPFPRQLPSVVAASGCRTAVGVAVMASLSAFAVRMDSLGFPPISIKTLCDCTVFCSVSFSSPSSVLPLSRTVQVAPPHIS